VKNIFVRNIQEMYALEKVLVM